MPSRHVVRPPYPEGLMKIWRECLSGHTQRVSSVCALPDGGIVSGSWDGTLRIWQSNGDCKVLTVPGEGRHVELIQQQVLSICVANGNIVIGSADNNVRVWDYEKLKVLSGHDGWVICVCALPGQSEGSTERIVSGSTDTTLRVWNPDTDECEVLMGHTGGVTSVCVAGGRIVSGSKDTTLRIWNSDGTCKVVEGHTAGVNSVCVANGRIVSGSDDRTIRVWDYDGRCLNVLGRNREFFNIICALPNGNIVSGSTDVLNRDANILRVWDSSYNKLLKVHLEKDTYITSILAINDDEFVTGYNNYSVAGDETFEIAKWNIRNLDTIPSEQSFLRSLFSRQTNRVAPLPSLTQSAKVAPAPFEGGRRKVTRKTRKNKRKKSRRR